MTKTLRYYGPDDPGVSPGEEGWTLVTRDADGDMTAEDIITDDEAQRLREAGVQMDGDEPGLRIGGLVEIARLLGVHPQTVKGWRERKVMPGYVGTVSGRPAYDLDRVGRWYRETPPQSGRPRS